MRLDIVVPISADLEIATDDPWLVGQVEAAILRRATSWTPPTCLGETDQAPDGAKWDVPGCRLLRFTCDAIPR